MAGRADNPQAEAVARLQASVAELRAELMVTQAALAAAMAEIARRAPDPSGSMGDAVVRLLGFAGAAGAGLANRPGVQPETVSASAERMAGWAEGLLASWR